MREAYVQLLCQTCKKNWETNPSELPAVDDAFVCPDCGTERTVAEFMRTSRDLQIFKDLTSD